MEDIEVNKKILTRAVKATLSWAAAVSSTEDIFLAKPLLGCLYNQLATSSLSSTGRDKRALVVDIIHIVSDDG